MAGMPSKGEITITSKNAAKIFDAAREKIDNLVIGNAKWICPIFWMYCPRCLKVHVFNKKTNKKCRDQIMKIISAQLAK